MMFFGFMKFGSVIKYIPFPITTGFTSGIALTLFSTQVKDFLGLSIQNVPSEFFEKWQAYLTHIPTAHIATLLVGVVSLLIIVLWPKINKTIPGSLIALIVATLAVTIFHLPVETIGSRFGQLSSSINFIDLKGFNLTLSTIKQLVMPAITIAFLASIESLLSAVVADGMIGKKHNSNMELIAQGIANIVCALFGGIPATGAIARTAANVKNGGRTPIAGIVHALVVFLIMIVCMPIAKLIPMTTLAAILITVAYNMSQWRTFKGLLKSTKSDIAVLLVTFAFTVVFDLVVAIEIGMVIAMFLFVKRMSECTKFTDASLNYQQAFEENAEEDENSDFAEEDNLREHLDSNIFLYEINGPLFFGAANTFMDAMNEVNSRSSIIILRMKDVPSMDATAFNALKTIDRRCRAKHILILYSEVNEQPMNLLSSIGFVSNIGEDRFFETTESAIKTANEIISCKVCG